MGVIRKSISFTEQQDTYIRGLIEKGFYTNDIGRVQEIGRYYIAIERRMLSRFRFKA